MLAIINDLLDFARVDARRVELRITPLPVRDIRLAVDPVCRPQIDSKQLSYEWHALGDQHDRAGGSREGPADRRQPRLERVQVHAARRLDRRRLRAVDRAVELKVSDTGPGIPAQKLDAIFEPFVQLDNGLTRATAGTGLGLAISRELARAMGGDLVGHERVRSGLDVHADAPARRRRVRASARAYDDHVGFIVGSGTSSKSTGCM